MTVAITQAHVLSWDGPCSEGCPGYIASDCNREPVKARAVGHTGLELQRCDACEKFASDAHAHAQWVCDGRLV